MFQFLYVQTIQGEKNTSKMDKDDNITLLHSNISQNLL